MKQLFVEWKDRLGLQDWHIELRDNCSPNDMNLRDCAGETEWQEVSKCAVIRIINEKDMEIELFLLIKKKHWYTNYCIVSLVY